MTPQRLVVAIATLLVGLSAGFFFTYEASVTLALGEVGDVTYVETFQAVNETVRNPAFGIVFFGSIPAIVLAIVLTWTDASPRRRALLIVALASYLVGIVVTGTGNVPLNDQLAASTSLTAEIAAQARREFEADWNRLNLLRSLAIGVSFVALVAAGTFTPGANRNRNDRRSIGETASS